MPNAKAQRVNLICDGCSREGSISWEELPRSDPKAEPKIRSIQMIGFYQQPGLGIPAVFCGHCGTMKTMQG